MTNFIHHFFILSTRIIIAELCGRRITNFVRIANHSFNQVIMIKPPILVVVDDELFASKSFSCMRAFIRIELLGLEK